VGALAPLPGRKNVVLMTQAVGWPPYKNMELVRQLAEQANRADVAIYLLDPRKLASAWGRMPYAALLSSGSGPLELVQATGGLAAYAPDPPLSETLYRQTHPDADSLNAAWERARSLESSLDRMLTRMSGGYYLISYEAGQPGGAASGVKLSLGRSGLTAHWRDGRYQPRAAGGPPELNVQVMPFVSANPENPKTHTRQPILKSVTAIDLKGLRLEDQPDGAKRATVKLQVKAEGGGNASSVGVSLFASRRVPRPLLAEKSCEMTIPADEIPTLASHRLLCEVELLPPAPGPYVVTATVTDPATGATGSAYALALVPNFSREHIWASTLELTRSGAEVVAEDAPAGANPVERVFAPGDTVTYRCVVFGAKVKKKTKSPSLRVSIDVGAVDDSAAGFAEPEEWLRLTNGPRQEAAGRFQLPAGATPGLYVLTLTVTDTRAPAEAASGYVSPPGGIDGPGGGGGGGYVRLITSYTQRMGLWIR